MVNTYNYIVANRSSGRIYCSGVSQEEPTGFASNGYPIDLDKDIWLLFAKDGDYIGANSSYDEYFDRESGQTLPKSSLNLSYSHQLTDRILKLDVGESFTITNIPLKDTIIKLVKTKNNDESVETQIHSNSTISVITENEQCYVHVEIDSPKYFKESFTLKFK